MRLVVATEQPFSPRDYERFGIERLKSWCSEVLVADCSGWIGSGRGRASPQDEVYCIDGAFEAEAFLPGPEFAWVLFDHTRQGSHSRVLREIARSRGARIARIRGGLLPDPAAANPLVTLLRTAKRVLLPPHRNDRPDFLFAGGEAALTDRVSAEGLRFQVHSFDYELFRASGRKARDEGFIVFLDENIVDHEDYGAANLSTPVTRSSYYRHLRRFLSRASATFDLPVVIAPHPRTDIPRLRAELEPFTVAASPTHDLVRRASLVVSHASTAQSFAVLWKKPIMIVTSDEIDRTWYGAHVRGRAEFFNVRCLRIEDSQADFEAHGLLSRAGERYGEYERKFLKTREAPDEPLWDIVGRCLTDFGRKAGA